MPGLERDGLISEPTTRVRLTFLKGSEERTTDHACDVLMTLIDGSS
jgi:hypothetical protein